MSGLQLFLYLALAIFAVGTIYKLIKIARMPLHLRWDLYPIPHEKGKGHYGGSYYEEVDWWTKPMNTTLIGEISAMAKEIIFIQSMYHHNRSLWIFSFPFHFGLYLMVGMVMLLALGGAMANAGAEISAAAGSLGSLLYYLTLLCAAVGSILMTLGAVGLFFSRLAKTELRASSVRVDYFNLILLASVGITLIGLWASADSGLAAARTAMGSLLTFTPLPELPGLLTTHLVLAGIFLLWLPMTHMTHFVGKYFTYHKVRWEDHPNLRGSKIEATVTKALGYQITWAAPHIKGGINWVQAATGTGKEEKKS